MPNIHNKNKIRITVNTKTYPIEAIYQACYVFLDKAYIFLDSPTPNKVLIVIGGKRGTSEKQKESLRGEFLNELLNCSLRLEINKRNKKIREAIIGQALMSALGEEASFQDDPLGIAIPWEEKFGKKDRNKQKRNSRLRS